MAEAVLVASGDAGVRQLVGRSLEREGYDVVLAATGEEALDAAVDPAPALVVVDVALPGVGGLDVCRRLRADARTAVVPVILLAAPTNTADLVRGLAAGADDYVVTPLEPVALLARVRTTLRRVRELRATSPLTGLPGNYRIGQEIARRLAEAEPTAVVHADLTDFKAYNDRYGFLRGDEAIVLTAAVLAEALRQHASEEAFLGHVGGDDFVLVCRPEEATAVCEAAVEAFDRRSPDLYDPGDRDRGYLELPDRRGVVQRFPLSSLALGVATTERRSYSDAREMASVATEMKSFVKRHRPGSGFAVDARRGAAAPGADSERSDRGGTGY